MASKTAVEITPHPSALIQSLRGLGYSPETALADLVDNSIAAGSNSMEVDLAWNEGNPSVATLDDGHGMSWERLAEAMRLGGTGIASERHSGDLGRFGFGLKTASLSQCRRLTVISRQAGQTSALTLDIDVVAERGWIATVPDPLPNHALVEKLLARNDGTLVLWERMDGLGGLTGLDKEAFFLRIEAVRAHLGMVFHRFLAGDGRRISIFVNARAVKAWDPFQKDHPAIIELRSERIRHGRSAFTVKPYVLPHRDRFANDAAYEAAGGPGGWGARQGFYVYRGKRLLVAGSWLGLGGARAWSRDESSRLARIAIDLPTDMDTDWRIDVRKSQASPPGRLRARLTAIASQCRHQAREVFAWRGKGPRDASGPRPPPDPVWLAHSGTAGTRYRINRNHPAVISFVEKTGAERSLVEALLSVFEQSVPIERIWLDVSEAEGARHKKLDTHEVELLAKQLAELASILPANMPVPERVDLLLRSMPGQQTDLRRKLTATLEAAT
jgi:hypothetical protein